ncbi:glycoside hydrolase family protein [Kaistia sp. MMO-174]|uniref:glycoside hydrolase family protein n=1 Tax=Kaistia sp. MMO-174 TaxID=3081256 RepID=UPI0030190B8C
METSSSGLEQLIAEEGEVLRAYKDVAGVWTIGVGLTKASGVVVPKAGMTITREQSRALLATALERNYEPAVGYHMTSAAQHEFDGGVLFHFNTGAIGRASWVDSWRRKDRPGVRAGLLAWNKAGGKVVSGLTARRQREADLILDRKYMTAAAPSSAALKPGASGDAVAALQEQLRSAGLYNGAIDGRYGPATVEAVKVLQRSHANLTVDGIAGPATRAALQRQLDLKKKVTATAAGGGLGTGGVATASQTPANVDQVAGLSTWWIAGGILAVTLVALALFAWTYRDEIRAKWRQWRR